MPQSSFSIPNETFPAFRSDLNTGLQALATLSAGATAPTTTYNYQLWVDTTNGLLKIRNSTNASWIIVGRVDANGWNMVTFAGNPNTNITGYYIGQFCVDTTNNKLYVCTVAGTSPATSIWDSSTTQNAIKKSIAGLDPGFDVTTPATKGTILPGVCVDTNGTSLINVTALLTVNIAVNGANGLDTGTKANSTWYYLWAIGKTDGSGTSAGLFSLSSTAPTMPSGYTVKRLLASYKTDASGNFLKWGLAEGWPFKAQFIYDVNFTKTTNASTFTVGTTNVLNAGTATTWAAVSLASFVPPIAKKAGMLMISGSFSAFGYFSIRPTGSATTGKQAVLANPSSMLMGINPNSSQSIDYQRDAGTGNLILDVESYTLDL